MVKSTTDPTSLSKAGMAVVVPNVCPREHLGSSWGRANRSILSMLSCADDHDEVVRNAQTHGSGDGSQYSAALSHVQQNAVRRMGAVRNVHAADADLAA